MANENQNSNYGKTIAKATGNTPAIKPIGEAAAMFTAFTPADLNALAMSGQVEFAPQMMQIEEGQKIEGILEGMGPGNDFVDEDSGIVRHVDSWIIASPDGGLRVSILSSAQLDKKLPPFVGGPVGIARNKDLKISGGHRCADYHVWGPKRTDGTRRTWSSLPAAAVEAKQIAAPAPEVIDQAGANHVTSPAAS